MRPLLRIHTAQIPQIRSAIVCRIGVENLLPRPWQGQADSIVFSQHGGVKLHTTATISLGSLPVRSQLSNAGIVILAVQPCEAARIGVEHVERLAGPVQTVKVSHQPLQAAVGRAFRHVPVQAPLVTPFAGLAELAAHE